MIDQVQATEPTTQRSPIGRAERIVGGMQCVDTSGNPRIPILMEMVGAISRAKDPQEVLREFSNGLSRLQAIEGYVSLSTRDLPPGHYRITRLIRDVAPERIADVDPWHDRDAIPVHKGGFFGEIIRQAYPEIIHHLNVRDDPVVGDRLAEFGSMMAVPLFDNGEPLNWSIALRRDPEAFTVEELEDVILRNNLVGSTIRNVLARQEIARTHETIRQEVQRIADIQRSLLPERMPDISGVKMAASYETFDQAGGDYYDFIPLRRTGNDRADGHPDEPWALFVADASGHGPAAAVVMAMLHAILHAYPNINAGPGSVMQYANQHLCEKRIESSFVTAFLGIYDPKTRRMTYARAGHNPPLVKAPGSGNPVQRIDHPGGIPLGVLDDFTYEESCIDLNPGESLVLFTDGISEASSPDGEMFGVEGLVDALTACTGDPDCVVDSVMNALREYEGGIRPSDDQTLVVMQVCDDD